VLLVTQALQKVAIRGVEFNPTALKMLRSELLAGQSIVEKHATRGKVMQILNSGEVRRDLAGVRGQVAAAFQALGVDPGELEAAAAAAGAGRGAWRWNGVWRWVPEASSSDTLARCSQDLSASLPGAEANAAAAALAAAAGARDVMLE
jgi:hypothetical protein